jgi:predicted ribosome quality control (RQC) complex YloA/Tae2 family protein
MPLDGTYLACLRQEFESTLQNARITRIYQPGKRELTISFRQPGSNHLLLISAHPLLARVHLTAESRDNPMKPPPFCMLMRKYWEGGRLLRITQPDLERILIFESQNIDEFGLVSQTELICECMGKHSNAILVKKEEGGGRKILGSLIPVYPEMSRVRTVLPGEPYMSPPPQEKFFPGSLGEGTREVLRERLQEQGQKSLKNALVSVVQGIGPLTAETLAREAGLPPTLTAEELDPHRFSLLWSSLLGLKDRLFREDFRPTLLLGPGGENLDFAALPLNKDRQGLSLKEFDSPSRLLDVFYTAKEASSKVKEMKALLEQKIHKELERLTRKAGYQRKELTGAEKGEAYRQQGEILTAHLYRVKRGEKSATLPDIYHPGEEDLCIPLDPSLSPAQNAQKYFKKYKKALTAKRELSRRIKSTELEIHYLEGLQFLLEEAGLDELLAIREELVEEGYIKPGKASEIKQKTVRENPLKFSSSDGILIFVGKNNRQNDLLTLKKADKEDLWFHVKDLPGSHVIVRNAAPPYKTLQEAALLAAHYSRGKNSANVAVDYTKVKNVRKPKGAKPGMVIYDNHKTLYVTPAREKLPTLTPPG